MKITIDIARFRTEVANPIDLLSLRLEELSEKVEMAKIPIKGIINKDASIIR